MNSPNNTLSWSTCWEGSRSWKWALKLPPLPFQARYPGLQAEFFERAAAPIARREAVLALLGLAGPAAILAWGAKGAAALKLPITVGPQKPPALGPRDKL